MPVMAGRAVDVFEQLRPEVIARLVEGRAALKLGLGAQAPEMARTQLEAVLDRMIRYLGAGDAGAGPAARIEPHRGFIARWVAYHLSEGFSAENLVHSMVTTGDILIQVARKNLAADPASAALIRDVSRMVQAMTRLVVDVLGEELAKLDPPGVSTVVE
jgi:hypothetical protein